MRQPRALQNGAHGVRDGGHSRNVTPATGVYHARGPPELSAAMKVQAIKNKKKVVTSQTLTVTVTVTDAGDAVAGATVTVKGHTKKSNSTGVAKITLPGAGAGKVTVTVTAPTYQKLSESVKL